MIVVTITTVGNVVSTMVYDAFFAATAAANAASASYSSYATCAATCAADCASIATHLTFDKNKIEEQIAKVVRENIIMPTQLINDYNKLIKQ